MSSHTGPVDPCSTPGALAGGGEMGARTRAFDWSSTPVGAIDRWPPHLKTAVSLVLNSRFPMFVWWGADFVNFYNDAYAPMLGARHPCALGRPARDTWSDVWAVVGPQAEAVLRDGEASWNEDLCLIMERHGFCEETYFTFSYSPVMNMEGTPEGVFCAVTEETARVLSVRRMKTLQELADRTRWDLDSRTHAAGASVEALADNPHDFAFAAIYLLDNSTETAELCDACRVEIGSTAAPAAVSLGSPDDVWQFASVAQSATTLVIDHVETRFGRLSAGAWNNDVCRNAAVIPLAAAGRNPGPLGFMVVGLSPRLRFDGRYRNFLELAAAQVAAAIANADAHEGHEALRASDQHKSEFLAMLGHELRTPLAPILNATEIMRLAGPENDRQRWARSVLERQVRFLASLIEDLLDVTRISRGQILLQRAPVDLRDIIQAAVEASRAVIDGHRHRLEVAIGGSIWVDGDRTRLVQVICNLLNNAAKYTDAGGTIQVSASTRGSDAIIRVSDDGVGMTADVLDRVFELFMQADRFHDRSHSGLGIGLTLARRLVELHGGTITAFSDGPGRGSEFVVTMPALGADRPA